jgi:U2-associated protein SR140
MVPWNKIREQEARDERMKQLREGTITVDDLSRDDGLGGRGGSFDEGDPYTTNIYLGNIAPDVDELILMREFGR